MWPASTFAITDVLRTLSAAALTLGLLMALTLTITYDRRGYRNASSACLWRCMTSVTLP